MPLLDIRDDTGVLADSLTDKYLYDADMGNFTSMTPGMTDVRFTTLNISYKMMKRN